MKTLTPYRKDLISRLFQEIQKLKTDDFLKYKRVIKGHIIFIKQLQS